MMRLLISLAHVATTPASTTDDAMTEPIHHDLRRDELLPAHHLLDSGYITAHLLATSQQTFGVELIGPGKVNVRWQANTPQGLDNSQFQIDWEHQRAVCPEGQSSISWTPTKDNRQHEVIKIRFSTTDCRQCPRLALCTYSKSKYPRRLLTVRPQQQHEALQTARQTQQTQRFTLQYARREGIEATISESGCVLLMYDVRAMLAWRRPDYNISALLRLSTWFALPHGFAENLPLPHVSQLLSGSSRLRSEGLPAVSKSWMSQIYAGVDR